MVFGLFKGFGRWPAEYNPKVHGPYNPSVFYGKKDTPFGEVKLGELSQWFGRRRKSPQAVVAATSRAWWHWQMKYIHPKKGGITPLVHIVVGAMIFFYVINWNKIKYHRHYKHRW